MAIAFGLKQSRNELISLPIDQKAKTKRSLKEISVLLFPTLFRDKLKSNHASNKKKKSNHAVLAIYNDRIENIYIIMTNPFFFFSEISDFQ